MGNFQSVNMEEHFKKNQDFIASISKVKMERQIQMMYQLNERKMALDIAKKREIANWLMTFYAAAAVGLLTGFRRTKRSYVLAPLLPMTFITGYYVDYGYGNKAHRIQQEAENIMQFEEELLEMPCGIPSASDIDQARLDVEEKKKLHPHTI